MEPNLPTPNNVSSPAKQCGHLHCNNKVIGRAYCPAHEKKRERSGRWNGEKTDPFYTRKRWRDLTTSYRKKHPLCEKCEERGHTVTADVTDHITPIKEGGAKYDERNLQALCHSCHQRKTRREQEYFKNLFTKKVTVISGPPGAGKTTYVKDHISKGELVVDLDAIYQALTFQPAYVKPKPIEEFAYQVRSRIYHMLKEPNDLKKAWVINSYPKASKRKDLMNHLLANGILLLPDKEICKARVKDRIDTYQWDKVIDDWYRKYEPLGDEKVIANE